MVEATKPPPTAVSKDAPAKSWGDAAQRSATPPDAYDDGPAYLRWHNWKCLGNPQGAGWLDPTCPPVAQYRKVKLQAPSWKTGQMEDVVADDGTGKKVVVHQTVYESPAEPIPLQQALMIQLDRDRKALLVQAREQQRKVSA